MPDIAQPSLIDQFREVMEEEDFFHHPLEFVYWVFPWGEPNTFLHDADGPDEWQCQVLEWLGEGTIDMHEALQIAVASGHGIGKSALVAWIVIWFISTRPEPQIVVTANTKNQLDTKTWREVAKWVKVSLLKDCLKWTATKLAVIGCEATWFASAIPWSKENSEAFAGTHEKYVLIIFDEASKIDDIIWEVTSGALTTTNVIWVCFGNPTQNTGRFKECFGKERHRWLTMQVDSRDAKMANKKQLDNWIQDYGVDSDFCRVRVLGKFPRASSMQFIGEDVVDEAIARWGKYPAHIYKDYPKLLGCDVARFGDDECVISVRQGLHIHELRRFREIDTMTYTAEIIRCFREYKAQYIFVDVGGIGAGVVDRLMQLGFPVIPVGFGERASNPIKYANKRSEIWGKMRDWLKAGGTLPPKDKEIKDDLIGPEYGYNGREAIQLEKKKDMKDRGLASPDGGDAVATTFALPVMAEGSRRIAQAKRGSASQARRRKYASSRTGY